MLKGETYDNIIPQAFGARVIVGYTTSSDNNDLYGEFLYCRTHSHLIMG